MNIVCIYPYLTLEYNSIAQVPMYLAEQGHNILIVTSRNVKGLKGTFSSPVEEQHGRLEFFRIYDTSKELRESPEVAWDEVEKKIEGFGPDLIYCSGEFNIKLGRLVKNRFSLPMVMLVEYLSSYKLSLPYIKKRYYWHQLRLDFILDIVRYFYLKKLFVGVNALMVVYPGDRSLFSKYERADFPIYYAPWCNHVDFSSITLSDNRERGLGVHIGGLEKFKNSQELLTAIPLILDNTPTEKFIVVGPGYYAQGIKKLVKKFNGRLEYIESMPRKDALNLLSSAFYAYTPAIDAGLGFIGDAWATRTPLIATHSVGGLLEHSDNALVARNVEAIGAEIDRLYADADLYGRLQEKGYSQFMADHSKDATGKRYMNIFEMVLNNRQGSI